MMTKDIHTALPPLLARYEQVAYLVDEHVPAFRGDHTLVLSTSEQTKTIDTVQTIWDFLFEQQMTRRGLLVCVGGGVLTDLGGFAAGTYKRGIDYINIPTTLLAMVDASTGGKTACNYHGLKNAVGLFYPPVETLICPAWLETLPTDQLLSGFAEMLKTGLLDESLWLDLLRYDLEAFDLEALTPLIKRCIAVKQCIVETDPREDGLRKVLNLGHTFGHTFEAISNQQSAISTLLHGYAVLYGLIAELYLSVTLLGCPREPLQQLTAIMLRYYGRPRCDCKDRDALIALMKQDKKNERAAQINCTLLQTIGQPLINQSVTEEQAQEALEYLFSL